MALLTASSIGIIGGADGPTVIYTTGHAPLLMFIAIAICITAIVLLIFWALRRHRK